MNYDHLKIEKKWQSKWSKDKIYQTKDCLNKPKTYVLDMFPYPSGDGLHVGHPKGYIATDIYSRYNRMKGHNVLHPMGWDAFGLPAENYAIKNKVHPELAVKKNIKRFKEQLSKIGFDYDWSREINTTDPKYYKWTQWIFLQLYKKGLAYQSYEPINWCPSCQTGLANEDLEDGRCERCGSEIEKKPMRQWVLKITNYADRLLSDLAGLSWPESIKESQRHWIGKSEGAEISFPLKTKYKYVFLHGWRSTSKSAFFPWLKRELESQGHQVIALDLPNPYLPEPQKQADFVLSQVDFDKNTIIVAHSLGSIVSYRILEQIKEPIHKLILVAGLIEPRFKDKERPEAKYLLSWSFDFEKIKKNAKQIVILEDKNDVIIPDGESKTIKQNIGGEAFVIQANKPHFCAKVEPLVMEHCLDQIKIFTTRPDTIFGSTYLVLAPEHPLINHYKSVIDNWTEVETYINATKKQSELDRTAERKVKTGVQLKGLTAINPANNKPLPIWIADYVLPDYGTGAIMAVPAHDERDWQFAKQFKLPITHVINEDLPTMVNNAGRPYLGGGRLINSGKFDGLDNDKAMSAITRYVRGKSVTRYKLRDWVFSRQRYWGEPIPIIHCSKCGIVPVPEKDLPVTLPKVKSYAPSGTGESPLAKIDRWLKIKCPVCLSPAQRETNTMPQWAGSSWYYLRYLDPNNDKQLVDKKKEAYWSPVNIYVGGTEHATRHLIYARFWHKFLFDLGIVSRPEPFAELKNQGLISGSDGRKMSKRWGNVINPDDVVVNYGADTLRVYEMFMGPFEQGTAWSTENLIGSRRFLEKVWRLANKANKAYKNNNSELTSLLNQTIKQITKDIEQFNFNTAISAFMILANAWEKEEKISLAEWKSFLKLLAPFAPHITEELWTKCGGKKSIHLSSWPMFDEALIARAEVTIVVQINGRTKGTIKAPRDSSQTAIIDIIRHDSKLANLVKNAGQAKVIWVPNRLINIVS